MNNTAESTPANTSKPGLTEVGTQLSEAQLNLNRSLYEGAVESQKQLAAVATAFATAKQELDQETAKRAAEASNQYAKAAQETIGKENAQQLLAEAYQNYITTLDGLQTEAYRRLQELHSEYTGKWTQAAESAQKQARQQYVHHLKKVQQVWSTLDLEALLP